MQQRSPTKRSSKSKKKPIKVVYISNPMKVKVTASEFRALVQELTGQDAELPKDLSRFQNPDSDGGDGGHQTDSDNSVTKSTGHESDHTVVMPPHVDPNSNNSEGQVGSAMEGFELFDHDVFAPEIMENISAFLPPGIFYESAQVDEVFRRLDAV